MRWRRDQVLLRSATLGKRLLARGVARGTALVRTARLAQSSDGGGAFTGVAQLLTLWIVVAGHVTAWACIDCRGRDCDNKSSERQTGGNQERVDATLRKVTQ